MINCCRVPRLPLLRLHPVCGGRPRQTPLRHAAEKSETCFLCFSQGPWAFCAGKTSKGICGPKAAGAFPGPAHQHTDYRLERYDKFFSFSNLFVALVAPGYIGQIYRIENRPGQQSFHHPRFNTCDKKSRTRPRRVQMHKTILDNNSAQSKTQAHEEFPCASHHNHSLFMTVFVESAKTRVLHFGINTTSRLQSRTLW